MVTGFPSAPVLVDAVRNLPGFFFEKSLKKTTARSSASGLGVAGLSFKLRHYPGIGLCPRVYEITVGCIRFHPCLGKGIVLVSPLGHNLGFAPVFVRVKPGIDVGSYELPGLWSALILCYNRQRAGNPVAQLVI